MDRVRSLIERADRGEFTKDDLALFSEATRRALKYMLDRNIPITPKNFEIWFMVFLYLLLHDPDGSVEEAYKRVKKYLDEEDLRAENLRKKAEAVLDISSRKIGSLLDSIEEHDDIIDAQLKLLKTIEHTGLGSVIDTLLSHIERLRKLNERLKRELVEARETIENLKKRLYETVKKANTDPLTGLYNRGYLEEDLRKRIRRFDSKGEIFSVVMLDVDNFKRVNDVYGHLAGDQVLVTIASILRGDLRIDDLAARYGGEEFVVVLSRLDLNGATKVANRLRERIESTPIIWGEDIIRVTASFGVAQVKEGDTPKSLLDRADKALYLAKSDGKNCVRSERDVLVREGDR